MVGQRGDGYIKSETHLFRVVSLNFTLNVLFSVMGLVVSNIYLVFNLFGYSLSSGSHCAGRNSHTGGQQFDCTPAGQSEYILVILSSIYMISFLILLYFNAKRSVYRKNLQKLKDLADGQILLFFSVAITTFFVVFQASSAEGANQYTLIFPFIIGFLLLVAPIMLSKVVRDSYGETWDWPFIVFPFLVGFIRRASFPLALTAVILIIYETIFPDFIDSLSLFDEKSGSQCNIESKHLIGFSPLIFLAPLIVALLSRYVNANYWKFVSYKPSLFGILIYTAIASAIVVFSHRDEYVFLSCSQAGVEGLIFNFAEWSVGVLFILTSVYVFGMQRQDMRVAGIAYLDIAIPKFLRPIVISAGLSIFITVLLFVARLSSDFALDYSVIISSFLLNFVAVFIIFVILSVSFRREQKCEFISSFLSQMEKNQSS